MATYGTFVRAIDNGNGSISYENYTLYGRPGSTMLDEFNRLANGGASYPTYDNYLDLQGAVHKWTSQEAGMGIIKALNLSVGMTSPTQFMELNHVLNYWVELNSEGGEVDITGPEMQPRNFLEAVVALRLIAS